MTEIRSNHTRSQDLPWYSRSLQTLLQNPGFSLAGLNVTLVLFAFLLFDPFGWIRTSYQDADSLLDVSPARIDLIQVQGSDGDFSLRRGNALALPETETDDDRNGPEPSREQELLQKVQGFRWELLTGDPSGNQRPAVGNGEGQRRDRSDSEGPPASHNQGQASDPRQADARRISRLLYSLQQSRKYYELDNSEENRKDFNLDEGILLTVVLDDGSKKPIRIGRSSVRGNESYVLVDDSIYLVQENLRRDLGAGRWEYFRNRQIMPLVSRDSITRLSARFKNPAALQMEAVELAKAARDWKMLSPTVSPVREMEMNLLLDDLLEIRAQEFLGELPPRLDRSQALELEMVYRTTIGNPQTLRLEILGKKSYDTYLFRTEDGILFEGSSLYLEKLFQPEQLMERAEEPMDFQMP